MYICTYRRDPVGLGQLVLKRTRGRLTSFWRSSSPLHRQLPPSSFLLFFSRDSPLETTPFWPPLLPTFPLFLSSRWTPRVSWPTRSHQVCPLAFPLSPSFAPSQAHLPSLLSPSLLFFRSPDDNTRKHATEQLENFANENFVSLQHQLWTPSFLQHMSICFRSSQLTLFSRSLSRCHVRCIQAGYIHTLVEQLSSEGAGLDVRSAAGLAIKNSLTAKVSRASYRLLRSSCPLWWSLIRLGGLRRAGSLFKGASEPRWSCELIGRKEGREGGVEVASTSSRLPRLLR